VTHYRHGNIPHVYRAIAATSEGDLILNLKLKAPHALLTDLEIYRCVNAITYSNSDTLLDTAIGWTTDINGDAILSINLGETISPLPDKLYLYVRWKSGDNTIVTDKSPIFCVNVK